MTTIGQTTQGVRALRTWAERRPLTVFLVVAFSLAYPLVSLPILASHGVIPGGSLPATVHVAPDEVAGLLMMLSLLTATVLVTSLTEGRPGLRSLARRILRRRVGLGWWVVVIAGLPALTVGFAVLFGDSLRPVDPVAFASSQLVSLLINFLVINLWEEAAYAGFLHTRLERRHNVVVAALLTAVVFGFMHWPLVLFGEVSAASIALGLIGFLVLGVFFRLMLGVTLRATGDSLLAVALLHSIFNRSNNDNGIAAGLLQGDSRALAILPAVVVLTVAIALAARHRLSRSYRVELDARASAPDQDPPTAAPVQSPRSTSAV